MTTPFAARGPQTQAGRQYSANLRLLRRYGGEVTIGRAYGINSRQQQLEALGHGDVITDAQIIQMLRFEREIPMPRGWVEYRLDVLIEDIYQYRTGNPVPGRQDWDVYSDGLIEDQYGGFTPIYRMALAPPPREWWFYH